MEEVLMCVQQCAGNSALVWAGLFVAYTVFNAWASTLKKEQWWEKLAHALAFNWGYLMQKPKKGPTP